ncbi:MAG TPA: RNA-binding domain-containing protein [Geobacteraceae bacterium]|nr:RNA-binding domain-containing protein [Geobacteraceae bacterium]
MKIAELKRLLKAGEWNDIEFKEARTAVPKSAFETVSAFANTHGGWLVFGVSQHGEEFKSTGVEMPEKVQGDFLSVLHADAKVNHDVQVTEKRYDIDGATVLAFHIAENPHTRKPVYLDGDIRRTFLRKGSGDYKAQMIDIERMLRDATADRWDSQPFDRVLLKEAFHPSSLRWYRDRFHQVNTGFDPKQPDQEFLYHWGYLLRDGKRFIPIRGAIMLFGSPLAIHQLIPRPTLDFQFLGYATDEPMPETRWIDRIVCEENIIQAWDQLVSKYKFFMPKPFKDIDPVTLGRRDDPPGFRVFREAAVNLLIHQDYGDHSRKAVIKFFRDGIQFWNPGDVFGDDSRLLEPGEKEVRNPVIATAMRRIAMCEQAGTGMRMMCEAWQALGHPAPVYKNDRAWKAFELFIPELDKEVDMASDLMKAMFGKTPTPSGGTETEQVEAHEKAQEAQVEAQVELLKWQHDILISCSSGEKTGRELLEIAGYSSRTGNFKKGLQRLLDYQLLELTVPDKPNSRLQKYRLTEKGRRVLAKSRGDKK